MRHPCAGEAKHLRQFGGAFVCPVGNVMDLTGVAQRRRHRDGEPHRQGIAHATAFALVRDGLQLHPWRRQIDGDRLISPTGHTRECERNHGERLVALIVWLAPQSSQCGVLLHIPDFASALGGQA
jgi:hypothetical protein